MVEEFCDRVIDRVERAKNAYTRMRINSRLGKADSSTGTEPALAVYSDPHFAKTVSAWGKGTAWTEIQYFLSMCHGRVLDMGCGPCTVHEDLKPLTQCEIHGCDISPYLIQAAIASGIPASRLTVCDATKTPYRDGGFDHVFSIGSLEHFTEAGIGGFLKEGRRVARGFSFHQIPTARDGRDQGWLRLDQSYFNNSVEWWLRRFSAVYPHVHVLDSRWRDPISLGKWFVCEPEEGR